MERGQRAKTKKQSAQSERDKSNNCGSTVTTVTADGAAIDNSIACDLRRTRDLSIDEVKGLDAFKHLADAEAMSMIETIKGYANVIYQWQVCSKNVA